MVVEKITSEEFGLLRETILSVNCEHCGRTKIDSAATYSQSQITDEKQFIRNAQLF